MKRLMLLSTIFFLALPLATHAEEHMEGKHAKKHHKLTEFVNKTPEEQEALVAGKEEAIAKKMVKMLEMRLEKLERVQEHMESADYIPEETMYALKNDVEVYRDEVLKHYIGEFTDAMDEGPEEITSRIADLVAEVFEYHQANHPARKIAATIKRAHIGHNMARIAAMTTKMDGRIAALTAEGVDTSALQEAFETFQTEMVVVMEDASMVQDLLEQVQNAEGEEIVRLSSEAHGMMKEVRMAFRDAVQALRSVFKSFRS